jgi:hypothetical protein
MTRLPSGRAARQMTIKAALFTWLHTCLVSRQSTHFNQARIFSATKPVSTSRWDQYKYKKRTSEHRSTSTLTTSYLEVMAFPSPSDAAVGLEQGVVQYMYDVYIDVLVTRHTKPPIRFFEKEEGAPNT